MATSIASPPIRAMYTDSSGNYYDYNSQQTSSSFRLAIGAIVGIAIGGFVILLIILLVCCLVFRRRRRSKANSGGTNMGNYSGASSGYNNYSNTTGNTTGDNDYKPTTGTYASNSQGTGPYGGQQTVGTSAATTSNYPTKTEQSYGAGQKNDYSGNNNNYNTSGNGAGFASNSGPAQGQQYQAYSAPNGPPPTHHGGAMSSNDQYLASSGGHGQGNTGGY